MSRLIIGCGYLGRRLAEYYCREGVAICGLVRSEESIERLADAGIRVLRADLDDPPLPALPLADADVFYFVPPPAVGTQDTRSTHLIATCKEQGEPRRVVYLSTTGVYGDCGGAWIDERQRVRPDVPRARRRWDAEQRWRAWSASGGGELVILRVAGIYGPGRLPVDRLRQGLPMVRAEESPWSNRIHVDDLVQACVAAMERGRDGEIYNVSDGHPSTMTDYFNQVADATGLARPPLISLSEGEDRLSAGMMSYLRESRRLDNRKLLKELGVTLRYPDLQAGLPSCVVPD